MQTSNAYQPRASENELTRVDVVVMMLVLLATAPLARSPEPAAPPSEAPAPATPALRDELDAELLPIFLDEGNELLHGLDTALRAWRAQPDDATQPAAVARLLHTLKGSARMVGAMSFGAAIHELETRLDRARRLDPDGTGIIDELESALDRSRQTLETLGTALKLPPQHERLRPRIEATLPKLKVPA